MLCGILAGLTWAIDTVILGVALSMTPFVNSTQAAFLAPFVSTFLHDLFAALTATVFNGVRGKLPDVWRALRTRSGRGIVVAAVISAPVGMTGYVMAVNYMGASVGAVATAIFPAIGAVLAVIFLKEKMQWYRWIFLIATLLGVYGLSYSPDMEIKNFGLGIVGAVMCAVGWGVEAVIAAKCMQDVAVKDEYAIQIRESTSAVVYAVILLPILRGWSFTISLFNPANGMLIPLIAIAGILGCVSYMFYYKAIAQIGASKSMALNITYAAWAILFTVVILRDTSVLTPVTIGCAIVVIVCGILAAADFKELFSKSQS